MKRKISKLLLAIATVAFASALAAPVMAWADGAVAKIEGTEYSNFSDAMTAANVATGNVVVDVYGEVEFVNGMELKGSYTSITFNGMTENAKITINQSAGGDYLEAHGKTVAFNDLTLAKANPAWAGNSGHMGNYFSIQGGTVTYTDCTFLNGACTSGGTATYTGCTFQNASEFGLWVYDDALVTVNGGTIDSKKGIKVYSEDEATVTSTLTVQNATFTENITKPAVAIGYASEVKLLGNTYNNAAGVLELDSGSDADCEGVAFVAKDANGNDISATLTAKDRSNGDAACGVLVGGKIYTTVNSASNDATVGSTVTLLHDSTETVELAYGVTLVKNGYTADGVTVSDTKPAATGNITPVYTRGNGFWGEGGGNATESLVVELYEGETKIATAALNNLEGIIDGDVYVTWSIPFAGSTDGYWNVEWAEGYPKYDMAPTKGVMVIDGTAVAESTVQFNAPDNLNKIVALAEGFTGGVVAYTSLADAIGNFNGRQVNVLRDVTEPIEAFNGATLTTNVEGGVAVTSTYDEWIYANDFNIGKGVTVVGGGVFYETDGVNTIEGTLKVTGTFYHGYNAKTAVQNGGNIIVEGDYASTILRYNTNADAGLYIYGDGNDETVEFSNSYYIGAYSGTFYAEDANIQTGYLLLQSSNDDSDYADIDMTLNSSILTVTGVSATGQDDLIIDDKASVTLRNGSSLNAADFIVKEGTDLALSVDETSSVSATNVLVAEGVGWEATVNEDGTVAFAKTPKGTGTAEDPYLISDLEELAWFRDDVNGGNDYAGKFVKLAQNIDFGSEAWTPIGGSILGYESDDEPIRSVFKGVFDGGGFTIGNLVVDSEGSFAGLFGKVADATIKNVSIVNASVSGVSNVGALVGEAHTGSVENCAVSGCIVVEGNYKVGGLVGSGYASIVDCSVAGDGEGTSSVTGVYSADGDNLEGDNVGGLVGFLGEGATKVEGCTVSDITVTGTRKVGGVVGSAFQNNIIVDVVAANVTVGTNATEEYAEDKAYSMGVGGLVGLYTANGQNGGTLEGVVDEVTLVAPDGVSASMGYATGGLRGEETPVAPSALTEVDVMLVGKNSGQTENVDDWGVEPAESVYVVVTALDAWKYYGQDDPAALDVIHEAFGLDDYGWGMKSTVWREAGEDVGSYAIRVDVEDVTVYDENNDELYIDVYVKVVPGTFTIKPIPSVPSNPLPDTGSDCADDAACNKFTDVDEGAWYHEVIDWAVAEGVLRGYVGADGNLTGKLGPLDELQRAQLLAMLHRIEGEPVAAAECTFSDVVDGAWYAGVMAWAQQEGLIMGDAGKTTVRPTDDLTREELAVILWRWAEWKGLDVSVGEDADVLSYADADQISSWAMPAVQWAVAEGVISGYTDANGEPTGCIGPKDTAERAQVAAMLSRLDAKHGIV